MKTTTNNNANADAPKKRRGRPPKKAAVNQLELEDINVAEEMAKAPDDLSVRSDLAASLSEEMIGEKTNEDFGSDGSVDYVFTGKIEVVGKISGKEAKKYVTIGTSRAGMRALVQQYDSQQKNRIRSENRLRAMMQGYDDAIDDGVMNAMQLVVDSERILEKNTLEIISAVSKSNRVCQWMNQIYGIGPRISSFYVSYIDITKAPHHSSIDHYCGYNTQNAPNYNDSQVDMILDRVLGTRKEITEDDIAIIAKHTGRNLDFIYTRGRPCDAETGEYKWFNRTTLHACLKIPYYNKNMRKLMWLITDQFRRRSTAFDPKTGELKSKYAKIYKEAKADQLARNMDKMFAEQAYEILQTNKIKNKKVLEYLENGMLTPGHIEARSQRKAGSVFNYDCWVAMHLDAYPGEQVTLPYPILFCGHSDFSGPEVPYEDFFEIPKGGIYKPLPIRPEKAEECPRIEIWK